MDEGGEWDEGAATSTNSSAIRKERGGGGEEFFKEQIRSGLLVGSERERMGDEVVGVCVCVCVYVGMVG